MWQALKSLIVVALAVSWSTTIEAARSKTMSSQQSPIKLVGWPVALNFWHRDRGFSKNYALRQYVALAKNNYNDTRSFISVTEVQPGFIWRGAGGRDIRKTKAFAAPSGWVSSLTGAKFAPGQKFACDDDAACQFRALNFTLGDVRCQWVGFNPSYGTQNESLSSHSSDFRVSLSMVHCGNSKPFLRKHLKIDHKANTLTITYPDPKRPVAPQTPTER